MIDADVNATDIGLWAELELRLMRSLSLRCARGSAATGSRFQIDDRMPRAGAAMEPRGRRDAQGIHLGPRATARLRFAADWT